MTSSAPPPPSDPQSAPPPAAPPPAAPSDYTPPQYAAPPPGASARPGMVTGAGVTMIVIGALITLFGLLALLVGGLIGGAAGEFDIEGAPGFGAVGGAFAGVVIVFAVIVLAIGILDIVAGINVLGGRGWARMTGIVLAAILGLFSLLGLAGGDQGGNVLFSLIMVAANAFIVWALWTSGGWFAARAP